VNTNTKQTAIQHVVTHTAPHLDEVASLQLFQKGYGERLFPGSTEAASRVLFTEGMQQKDDTFYDSIKMMPIGCVPGTRFNDKDKDGRRIPAVCTTTKVMEYLNLNEDKVLKRIADDVLRCDTEPGVKNTELAELIKMGHRRVKDDTIMLKWATALLDAVHSQLTFGFAPIGRRTLQTEFDRLLDAGRFPDDRVRGKLANMVKESMERKDESIMELSFIADCLFRTSNPDAGDLIQFALDHIYEDQLMFWQAVEECRQSNDRHVIRSFDGERPRDLRVLFVKSDNQNIIRASRHREAGGAGVTIIRNSKGNVTVFTDRQRSDVCLDEFVAMVRWLEWPKDSSGGPTTPMPIWKEFQVDGVMEPVSQWYYHKRAGQLLNGSLSFPNKPASQMASQAFIDVARAASNPREVNEWKRVRGVSRCEDSAKPQPKGLTKIELILEVNDPVPAVSVSEVPTQSAISVSAAKE